MAINKVMKAALKAISFPELDIKKSYKLLRRLERITAKLVTNSKDCIIKDTVVLGQDANIPVRIFSSKSNKAKGVILFFHGGGWVNGDTDTYAGTCIRMVQELSRTVVAVDYRRAPEYKFPHASEDCYEVARQIFAGQFLSEFLPEFLPDDICLAGDSAGGNLAAVISLMARDRGSFFPKQQILIYPVTNNDHSPTAPFDSIRTNGTNYLLTSKRVAGYMELYISSEADLENPYLAPLLAKNLSNQPKTLIITAEFCPLRDEGEEYGKRLLEAGNYVSICRIPEALHGYFSLPIKLRQIENTFSVMRQFLTNEPISEMSNTI